MAQVGDEARRLFDFRRLRTGLREKTDAGKLSLPVTTGDDDDDDEEDGCLSLLFPSTEGTQETVKLIIKHDYYTRSHARRDEDKSKTLTLTLVKKHHSLWGEFVYNAARVLADRIDAGLIDCEGKSCLELGAGAGLPGLVAALNGAARSVISDYGTPEDRDLIDVIDINCAALEAETKPGVLKGAGFIFGGDVEPLLSLAGPRRRFDLVLMADLIFNRSEHRKLLSTLRDCLSPDGQGWVTFSHHDPKKTPLDLAFFDIATEMGFSVERVGQEIRESYPFVQHDGLDERRGVVNIYLLTMLQPSGPSESEQSDNSNDKT